MSGSLPDEWFRARETSADQPAVPDSASTGGAGDEPTHDRQGTDESAESEQAVAEPRRQPDPETVGDAGHPAGTFGSNAAGATFSLGEVREAPASPRRGLRAARVRGAIQVTLLLSLSLAIGLLIGGWWSANVRSSAQQVVVSASASPSPSAAPTATASPSAVGPYTGAMTPLPVSAVDATCTQPPLREETGWVSYAATNLVDDNPDTAWRCYGDATGKKFTFHVAKGSTVVGFGVINGYAKTTPGGVNLYERYRRVLAVRWNLPDGRYAVQELTDHQEGEQKITIPPTSVDGRITMTILEVSPPGRGPTTLTNATVLSTVDIFTSQ